MLIIFNLTIHYLLNIGPLFLVDGASFFQGIHELNLRGLLSQSPSYNGPPQQTQQSQQRSSSQANQYSRQALQAMQNYQSNYFI